MTTPPRTPSEETTVKRFPASGRPAGRPFGSDYHRGRLLGEERDQRPVALTGGPAPVDEEARERRAYLRRFADELAMGPDAGEVLRRREAVTERLQDGWAVRGRGEVDVVRNRHGADVFPVHGEALVAPATWEEIREEAEEAGLTVLPLGHPELEGRIVRVGATDPRRARRVTALVGAMRERGHAISLSYLAPLGGTPTVKPNSGAFAARPAPFTAYAAGDEHHGDGVVVAVVDTGIAAEARSDGWLTDVVRVTTDDPTRHGDESNVDPLDCEPADGFLDVYAGHGTFVAGIVAQVAPGATVRVYKAVGPGGAGSELDVACALIRAVRDGADVVNLSLGTQTLFDEPSLPLGVALEVVREIEAERGRPAVVVAAAGNWGSSTPSWPAAFGRVVAVAGLTADLRPASWSSHGSWVDLSTVAEGVVSTFVPGRQNPQFGGATQEFGPDSFAYWVGTSFAAPQVSGAIARTMTELGVTGPEAVDALLAAGKPVAGFGKALQILPGA